MVYTQPNICPGEWDINSNGILTYKRSPNIGQKTRPYKKKKKTTE